VSTILKALRRLDEQRRSETAPRTLEEQVLAGGAGGAARGGPDARTRRRAIRLAGGALGVLAAAGASVLWLSREEPAVAVAVSQPERVAAAPPPALPAAVARAPRESLPAQGAPIAGEELDSTVRSALRPQSTRGDGALGSSAASARPAAGNQPEPNIGVEPANAGEEGAPVAATPTRFAVRSAREEPRAPAPAPAAQREVTPSAEPPQRAPLPEAQSEISPAPREPEPQPIAQEQPAAAPRVPAEPEPDVAVVAHRPEIWVESTEWHPSPEKRSARVRIGEDIARILREGDAVDGVVVKEIRPSGVVFLHEGAEFKRGVGGS
jgi:hypothetical protein